MSSRNASAAKIKSHGSFIEGDAAIHFAPEIAPLGNDIVVTKRRVSGFSGSDLDTVFRGLNVDGLVIGGIATSGAVLSTVRQAADMDYKLTVVGDLCLDLTKKSIVFWLRRSFRDRAARFPLRNGFGRSVTSRIRLRISQVVSSSTQMRFCFH